jgi:hypothetical protein
MPMNTKGVECNTSTIYRAKPQTIPKLNQTGEIIKSLIKSETIKPLLVRVRNPIWPLNKKRHVNVRIVVMFFLPLFLLFLRCVAMYWALSFIPSSGLDSACRYMPNKETKANECQQIKMQNETNEQH